MARVLEEKSIGLDQNNNAEKRAPDLGNQRIRLRD